MKEELQKRGIKDLFKTLEPFMKNSREIKQEIKFRVSIQFKSKTLHYGLHDSLFTKTDICLGGASKQNTPFSKNGPQKMHPRPQCLKQVLCFYVAHVI